MAKYCSTCGKEVHEKAVVCTNCGCQISPSYDDTPNMGLNILSLLLPIVGLILFCVNLSTRPISAKSYGVWALIGFVAGLVLTSCVAIM